MAASPRLSVAQSPPSSIGLFEVYEATYTATGSYSNPYAQVSATVALADPVGRQRSLPLFWDGGSSWKLRFSPDQTGTWIWAISSNDPGLNGRSGSVPVFPSTSRGGIRRADAAPYHFQHQDGTPFWWFGDTEWAIFTDNSAEGHDRASVLHYVDVRAGQGFNVVHGNLLNDQGWGNSGGAAFSDFATETINPAYWREVDLRLNYLNSKGITAGLFLGWANGSPSWTSFPSEAARLRYARFIAARYGAHNVYFIISGEWDENGGSAFYDAIGRELERYNAQGRMIGIHGTGSVESWATSSWMSFGDYKQTYTSLHSSILSARDHGKPVVNSEYAYYRRPAKENSETLEQVRNATWEIAMAGGYFVTGWGTTYFGGFRMDGPFNPDDPLDDDWEQDAQHVRSFFTGLPWTTLEPSDSFLLGTGTRFCLAAPGNTYVAYVRGATGVLSLSLGGAATATYSVRRFDPRTGASTDLPAYVGVGPVALTPPDAQDWVFVVSRSGGSNPDVIPPNPPLNFR